MVFRFFISFISFFITLNVWASQLEQTELIEIAINKALISREIKKKFSEEEIFISGEEEYQYTQTQAYLKLYLQDRYIENNTEENISTFLKEHCLYSNNDGRTLESLSHNLLVPTFNEIINEEKLNQEKFVFYNGLRGSLSLDAEISDLVKSIFLIAPINEKYRTYARLFDSYYQLEKDGEIKFIENINEFTEKFGFHDQDLEYKKRAGCLNCSLFGNTKNMGEHTLSYVMAGGKYFTYTVLEDMFKTLGLNDISYRVKRYEDLYQEEIFQNQYVLQQVFIEKDKVNDLLYQSTAFGARAYGNEDVREYLSEIRNLAKRETEEYIEEYWYTESEAHKMIHGSFDNSQQRVFWDPIALKNGSMKIRVHRIYKGSVEDNIHLAREYENSLRVLESYLVEDLKEVLEINPPALGDINGNIEELPLLRLLGYLQEENRNL